jgi:uncharacterized protein
VILKRALTLLCCVAFGLAAAPASAKPASAKPANAKEANAPIVIRAGKSDSPTHALARQFAEAVALAINGAYTLDVKESQGSVQNVMDAAKTDANTLFTAGPDIVAEARRGVKPFSPNRRYRDIRALVPLPAQTLHWVVREDSGITSLGELAGRSFIAGSKGSVGERLTVDALQSLGIINLVQLLDIDAAAATSALKSKQVYGIALAGAYPMNSLLEFARTTPIRLLSLPRPDLTRILAADDSAAAETVPSGTYPGMDSDVTTLAVPAGIYTTLRMRDATAYAITKAFWTQHAALAQRNPPWAAVNAAALATLKVRLHKGALRYYREAGIKVPRALR